MANELKHPGDGDVAYARITGVMTIADQRALEDLATQLIEAGRRPSLLVTLEHFEGWERSEGWGEDLQFQFDYAHAIGRIAVVGDARWKDQAMLFVGKGYRDTDVEFFTPDAAAAAERWIRR